MTDRILQAFLVLVAVVQIAFAAWSIFDMVERLSDLPHFETWGEL